MNCRELPGAIAGYCAPLSRQRAPRLASYVDKPDPLQKSHVVLHDLKTPLEFYKSGNLAERKGGPPPQHP